MFRVLGAVSGAAMTGLLVAAFTIGGFDVDDPQLEAFPHERLISHPRRAAQPGAGRRCGEVPPGHTNFR